MSEQLPSEQLHVGDVVVCLVGEICKGREGTLVAIHDGGRSDGRCGRGFLIEIRGHRSSLSHGFFKVYPDEVRKKKPPREDLTLARWNECPWQPKEVRA